MVSQADPDSAGHTKTIMNLKTALLAGAVLTAPFAQAQVSLTTVNDAIELDFSGFTAPTAWSNANGTGGALDHNTWAFTTGTRTAVAADFGSTVGTGGGTSSGGVSTNGIYAFSVDTGVTAWGFQATGGFGSPGNLTLRVQNNTGSVLNTLSVAYTAWHFNDAPRSGVLRPYYSFTNDGTAGSYLQSDGSNSDLTSPEAADVTPEWVSGTAAFNISGLNLADGANLYLRWGFNDSGSGSRDEWALSDVSITAVPEPSSYALLVGFLALGTVTLRRRRVRS